MKLNETVEEEKQVLLDEKDFEEYKVKYNKIE